MAKLKWDQTGERLYETGVDRGVLYPADENGSYPTGVAWNGLINVTESPSGAEPTPLYADNIKYVNMMSAEEFGGTIEAYTYPPEFAECNGAKSAATGLYVTQQARKTFGFCYRTLIGNDVVGNDFGYKLHLVYGALAAPSEESNASINDSPEAKTMSWEFSTTPVNVTGFKPTAHLIVDSTKVTPEKLSALEKLLYGDDTSGTAKLPLPDEVISTIGSGS